MMQSSTGCYKEHQMVKQIPSCSCQISYVGTHVSNATLHRSSFVCDGRTPGAVFTALHILCQLVKRQPHVSTHNECI